MFVTRNHSKKKISQRILSGELAATIITYFFLQHRQHFRTIICRKPRKQKRKSTSRMPLTPRLHLVNESNSVLLLKIWSKFDISAVSFPHLKPHCRGTILSASKKGTMAGIASPEKEAITEHRFPFLPCL